MRGVVFTASPITLQSRCKRVPNEPIHTYGHSWPSTPECSFKIGDQQSEKKRWNSDWRAICNATRGIEVGRGVILHRGVSDSSDGDILPGGKYFLLMHYHTSAANSSPIDLSDCYKKPYRSLGGTKPPKAKPILSSKSMKTLAILPMPPTLRLLRCQTLQRETLTGRSWSTSDTMTSLRLSTALSG